MPRHETKIISYKIDNGPMLTRGSIFKTIGGNEMVVQDITHHKKFPIVCKEVDDGTEGYKSFKTYNKNGKVSDIKKTSWDMLITGKNEPEEDDFDVFDFIGSLGN